MKRNAILNSVAAKISYVIIGLVEILLTKAILYGLMAYFCGLTMRKCFS